MPTSPLSLVVLISGGGSNLQALINAISAGTLHASIKLVVSNVAEAHGVERARRAGIETRILNHKEYSARREYDQALAHVIEPYNPDLIILAGFMRILSAGFVKQFRDRILNIHPSLLPALKGTDTHQRAIDTGLAEHGASVHLVTERLDDGPVIMQAKVPIKDDDSASTLAARVLQQEHRIYAEAIQLIAEGQIRIQGGV